MKPVDRDRRDRDREIDEAAQPRRHCCLELAHDDVLAVLHHQRIGAENQADQQEARELLGADEWQHEYTAHDDLRRRDEHQSSHDDHDECRENAFDDAHPVLPAGPVDGSWLRLLPRRGGRGASPGRASIT